MINTREKGKKRKKKGKKNRHDFCLAFYLHSQATRRINIRPTRAMLERFSNYESQIRADVNNSVTLSCDLLNTRAVIYIGCTKLYLFASPTAIRLGKK